MSLDITTSSRTSISELPEIATTTPDDYIILQSDNISYKIRIDNISLRRNNINFYNEIVQLNTLTNTLSSSIEEIDAKITTLSGEVASNLVEITKMNALNTQQKNDLTADIDANTSKISDLAGSNIQVKALVSKLDSKIELIKTEIEQQIALLDGRVALTEGAIADLLDVISHSPSSDASTPS